MPIKGGKMTPQERTFAAQYAATGDKVYSATKAGYGSPATRASVALQRPAVQAEIARQQQEILFREALPAAVKCLIEIATDNKAAAGARVQASKVILDRTLGVNEAMGGKEAHEMTAEEIAKAIDELKRLAADKARPVIDGELSSIDEEGPQSSIFE